jgi:hypothetical protein
LPKAICVNVSSESFHFGKMVRSLITLAWRSSMAEDVLRHWCQQTYSPTKRSPLSVAVLKVYPMPSTSKIVA